MRRYLQRIEVDRRCFLTKTRYLLRYPTKKAPVKFFETDAEKGVSNRKTRFPEKKNRNVAMFFVSKWRLLYTEIFA